MEKITKEWKKMEVSIDMLRLRTKVRKGDFQKFMDLFLKTDLDYTYFESFKYNEYRYNITVKCYSFNPFVTDASFYIGFGHNSELSEYNDVLVVEFNPNRCDYFYGFLNRLLCTFFSSPRKVKVVSLDIAVDIFGISMENCIADKGKKKRYLEYINNGARTLYIGKKGKDGSNGSTKIYDKGKEQKVDKVWTRYEVTLKLDLLYAQILSHITECNYELPIAYFINADKMNKFDVKMRCYIYTLLQGVAKIWEFPQVLRQNLRLCLENIALLKIDNEYKKHFDDIIIAFFEHYYKVVSKKNKDSVEEVPPKIIVGDVGEKVKDYIQLSIK